MNSARKIPNQRRKTHKKHTRKKKRDRRGQQAARRSTGTVPQRREHDEQLRDRSPQRRKLEWCGRVAGKWVATKPRPGNRWREQLSSISRRNEESAVASWRMGWTTFRMRQSLRRKGREGNLRRECCCIPVQMSSRRAVVDAWVPRTDIRSGATRAGDLECRDIRVGTRLGITEVDIVPVRSTT